MRKAPSSCVRVSVRLSETLRPGETPDDAVAHLLPRAIEELRARACACGLLPADADPMAPGLEHELEVETRGLEDGDGEVEVRVALFDRSRTTRPQAARPEFQRRARLGA